MTELEVLSVDDVKVACQVLDAYEEAEHRAHEKAKRRK